MGNKKKEKKKRPHELKKPLATLDARELVHYTAAASFEGLRNKKGYKS